MILPPSGGGGPGVTRRSRRWLAIGAALGMATTQGLGAQEAPPAREEQPPNPLLTFSLSQGASLERNPGLEPGGNDSQASLTTDLGLAFLSETPISSLAVSAQSGLDVALGSEDDGLTVEAPALDLSYQRAVPSASLSLDASFRRDDVAFLRSLDDFVGEDGVIDLPDDFDDLEGEGTRREARLDARLTLRDDRPLGIELFANLAAVDYQEVTSEELADTVEADLGATLRFDLTEVAQLRAGLRASRDEEEGSEPVTRLGFDLDGSLARPNGVLTAALSVDEDESGLRSTLSFGHDLELPLGIVSGRIGLTQVGDGDLALSGRLQVRRDLPRGSASLSLDRSVTTSDDGGGEVATALAARWSRELTPLVGLNLDALYSDREELDSGEGVRDLEVGATLDRQITRDWSLALGYRAQIRDETGEARARSDSLFLNLSRSFEMGL